jgi:hypothetical protein
VRLSRPVAAVALVDGTTLPASRRAWRPLGLPLIVWASAIALAFVLAGAFYSVWLARTSPPDPKLPAGPLHAVVLSRATTADMLQGNFITTNALYRSSDPPSAVIAYYRRLLHNDLPQFGRFTTFATTTAPSDTPAQAFQYMPALFNSPTKQNPDAALYVYTEYSKGQSDVAVAIDMRHPHGPTLVYLEMLTQPSDLPNYLGG